MPGAPSDSPRSPDGRGLPRAVDVALALFGLVLAAPVVAVAGVAVALSSRGPALFRQRRVGRNGETFVLLKLRTMRSGAAGSAVTAGGDPRVTAVGRFLRRTKVDELPQLWNVVRGEMALVGPRPEVPDYVDLSDPDWLRVLEARPGITDPVSLRLRFEEELLADVPGDRAEFYRRVLVPFKIRKYLEYQSVRTWRRDLETLSLTCLSAFFGRLVIPYRVEDVGPDVRKVIR
jgi:lipopolysaccharide/colanic/teichoic acid biosynthesis glycosyltransferase